MNDSETRAYHILDVKGWKPKKIQSRGMPDFECKNDRYVEVKKLIKNHYTIQINENQLTMWKKLLYQNKRIYLMIFKNNLTFHSMFKIEEANRDG